MAVKKATTTKDVVEDKPSGDAVKTATVTAESGTKVTVEADVAEKLRRSASFK